MCGSSCGGGRGLKREEDNKDVADGKHRMVVVMESSVLLVLSHPASHPWRTPTRPSQRHSLPPRYRRWDSNAETIRSKTFGFTFKNKPSPDDEDDYDEEEEDYGGMRRKKKKRRWWSDEPEEGGVLDEAIDTVWIFKVFKSYGWAFPFIIISLLFSTGPKAFLMALALPLAQSVLSLAFDKLFGRTERRPRRKSRRRRKPFVTSEPSVEMDEEEISDEYQETDSNTSDYRSWVVGDDVSVGSSGEAASSLGGWDDLERMQRMWPRKKSRGKDKLSRRERNSDTPLLLRLLIAAFPFLGSWLKIFW